MDSYMALNESCFMVTWTIFQKPSLGARPNTKPGDCGTPNTHNCWVFFCFNHVWGTAWIKILSNSIWLRAWHIWRHTTLEDPWPYYMILEVTWDGLWTRSLGLSQFHGHGSGLVFEVALIRFIFHALQLLSNRFTQRSFCWIGKSTIMHQHASEWKSSLPLFSYIYQNCMFVDSLRLHKGRFTWGPKSHLC